MICKECNVDKVKVKVPNSNKFNDDKGSRWNGLQCPECFLASRSTHKVFANKTTTKRFCRACTKKLPANKYFYHIECTPDIDFVEGFEECL